MFDVIAMIGTRGATSRIMAVADTPSNTGMMMSMKIRSNLSGLLLTIDTASEPSRYVEVSNRQRSKRLVIKLTAVSTWQSA
jgi:hypothetical protein